MGECSIIPLAERPKLVDCCVAWSFGEWGSQIETRTILQVHDDYVRSINGDVLPVTWMALWDDKPAGMIRLKKHCHIEREDLGPWLSSLYVHPRYRERGIAEKLCRHVEMAAKNVYGYEELYLYTGIAEKFYEKLGYKKIGTVQDRSGFHKNGEPLMMKRLD
jgi:GNAT superfamily N-acetyltransferase